MSNFKIDKLLKNTIELNSAIYLLWLETKDMITLCYLKLWHTHDWRLRIMITYMHDWRLRIMITLSYLKLAHACMSRYCWKPNFVLYPHLQIWINAVRIRCHCNRKQPDLLYMLQPVEEKSWDRSNAGNPPTPFILYHSPKKQPLPTNDLSICSYCKGSDHLNKAAPTVTQWFLSIRIIQLPSLPVFI